MKCQAVERLILEGEERPLREDERRTLDGHLAGCPDCRAFESGRADLRRSLADLSRPGLPSSVDLRTRRACLEELDLQRKVAATARVPVPVVAASALFALVAAVWLAVTLADVMPGDSLPWTAWAAVVFLAQSVFVLFLSPVIFRAARRPDLEGTQVS